MYTVHVSHCAVFVLLVYYLTDYFVSSFQSWFDFSSIVENAEGSTSEIIAKEKEDHVLSTLHEVRISVHVLYYNDRLIL